jgi:hypothetical protein
MNMSGDGVFRSNGPAGNAKASPPVSPGLTRLDDGIYQEGQLVARTLEAEVDLEGKEIRFSELCESDRLLLPDECEYQKYSILIQKVAFAGLDRSTPHKGRVLRGVVAEILRYRDE